MLLSQKKWNRHDLISKMYLCSILYTYKIILLCNVHDWPNIKCLNPSYKWDTDVNIHRSVNQARVLYFLQCKVMRLPLFWQYDIEETESTDWMCT